MVGLAVGLEVDAVLRDRLRVGSRRQPAVREGLLRFGGAGSARLLADAAFQQLGPFGHQAGKGDQDAPVAQGETPGVARGDASLQRLEADLPHGIRQAPPRREVGQLDPCLGAAVGRCGRIVSQPAQQHLGLG